MIEENLKLRNGMVLKNRIVKGAMTERISDEENRATENHARLYEKWSKGGCGVLITGNIQVDRRYMEAPRNVAIDGSQSKEQLERLKTFAKGGQHNGCKIIAQLGHAGRQSTKMVNKHLVGPSDIASRPLPFDPKDSTTRALNLKEIEDVKSRFLYAAQVCKNCGFDGVEIHGAHGYLISSFMNPLANERKDQYGGSLENRARLLLETVALLSELRDENFALFVKINSADFQQGGFTSEECEQVIQWLDEANVDVIEISGGNYESPALLSKSKASIFQSSPKESTLKREAFFIEIAAKIRKNVKNASLLVTGGFRTKDGMDEALNSGDTDLIGVGRPLCMDPDAPNKLLNGEIDEMPSIEKVDLPFILKPIQYFVKMFEVIAPMAHCYNQIRAMSEDQPMPTYRPLREVLGYLKREKDGAKSLKGIQAEGSAYNC